MIIDTKFLGQIEIKKEDIIYFEDGLLGFEDVKRYVLIPMDEKCAITNLQSVDRKEVSFLIINPWDYFKDYDIDVDDNEILSLGNNDIKDILVYSILTIAIDKVTSNLIGPLVINIKSLKGKQIVLHKSNYTSKHIVKSFAEKE